MSTREDPWPDGYPNWIDLMSSDVDAARSYYGDLFGWEFQGGDEMGGYWMALLDGKAVAGVGPMQMEGSPPTWTTYLATGDADATADAAVRAGGSIVLPVGDVGEFGRLAYVQDSTGATFGLWQAKQHIGCQRVNEPGTLIWSEVMTRGYGDAMDFYASVFGYTYTDLGGDQFEYSTIETDGHTIGGLGALPDEVPADVPAHWRTYFCVDDCDAAVARAEELGGSVRRPAEDMPYGRHADLADPQGAGFSVIKPTTPG